MVGNSRNQRSQNGMTVLTWVCWSMISETQMAYGSRVRRHGKSSTETVYLISSHPVEALRAAELANLKRAYWKIESALHYRLDEVLDEDRSRVRTPKAAHLLGMFRRLTVSFALPLQQEHGQVVSAGAFAA